MNRLRPAIVALLALWTLALSAGAAHASCTGLRFSLLPPVVNWSGAGAGYYVFDTVDRVQQVTFTVSKVSGTCSYFITASTELTSTPAQRLMVGGGNRLAFNIFTTSTKTNPIRDLPVLTANDIVAGTFATANFATNTHQYYFWIAPGQLAPPGIFTGLAQLKLFQGTLSSNSLVQMADVKYVANVRSVAEVSVVDPGRPFDATGGKTRIDFGYVKAGQKTDVDLRVRGNNGFDITIGSQNGGTMRPIVKGDPSYLPYALTIAGRELNLAGAAAPAASFAAATTADGVPFPLELVVGDPSHALAGSYTDVLTIVVTPR